MSARQTIRPNRKLAVRGVSFFSARIPRKCRRPRFFCEGVTVSLRDLEESCRQRVCRTSRHLLPLPGHFTDNCTSALRQVLWRACLLHAYVGLLANKCTGSCFSAGIIHLVSDRELSHQRDDVDHVSPRPGRIFDKPQNLYSSSKRTRKCPAN